MKQTLILIILLLAGTSFAAQRTETFSWTYTAEEQAKIDGFRIFMGCGSDECMVWEGIATDRSATITFEDAGKSQNFSAIAFDIAEDGEVIKSDQSDYAVWVLPKEKPHKMDNFRKE